MKKITNKNKEFNPYTFQFNLNNENYNNYSFVFDTASYIIWVGNQTLDENNTIIIFTKEGEKINAKEICKEDNFCWFKTNKKINKGYIGSIGISNKNMEIFNNNREDNKNKKYNFLNYYINKLIIKKEERYINFIQKNNNEASMIFGHNDDLFNKENSKKCQCKKNKKNENDEDNNIYWCCEISSIKIGIDDIYTVSNNNEYGIFSISEEYIIGPRNGIKILNYYEKLIKDTFGVNCQKRYNILTELRCASFNYKEIPNLYFEMKGDLGIVALSYDLFKSVDENDLEFKIKINNETKENIWYLGEPVIKNYNLLLNYTNFSDITLIIIPSSINGFFFISIAIIFGFIILLISIIIILYILKNAKEKNEINTFFNSFSQKKEKSFFSFGKISALKNNYNESIGIIEEEDEENDKNNIKNIKNNSFNNIELEDKNGNIINDSDSDNNIIRTNNNNNNLETPISVEFSLNDIGEELDDNDDLFIKKLKK